MGHSSFNNWIINSCGMQSALYIICEVPVWWYVYHRIKSDIYRSTEHTSNWFDGGITAFIMWVFFWWATLNLKHWRNVEAMQPWDAKCLSLTIWIMHVASLYHVDDVIDSVPRSILVTDGYCISSQKLYSEITDVLPHLYNRSVVKSKWKNGEMNNIVFVWLWWDLWMREAFEADEKF